MPLGTLKETLLFGEDAGAASHRYEIYKSDSWGRFFCNDLYAEITAYRSSGILGMEHRRNLFAFTRFIYSQRAHGV